MRESTVAIAGCGVIAAVGNGVGALRDALRSNASGLRQCDRFNHARFQSSMVGAALDESPTLADDPALQLASTALTEARGNARPSLANLSSDRLGLVLSTTNANIEALER